MTRGIGFAILGAVALTLGACGSDKGQSSPAVLFGKTLAGVVMGNGGGAAPAQVSRAELEKLGTPVIMGTIASSGGLLYLVPISQQGNVVTWSTSNDITITFKDDVMSQTRGIGPDIMESATPSRSQLQNPGSTYRRSYAYLDGGDRLVRFTYDCAVSFAGAETITVVGRQHSTRHMLEQCTGNRGQFTNEYWFESDGKVRKSKELLVTEWGPIELFRVIDRG